MPKTSGGRLRDLELLPRNPDPESDLGYQLLELDVLHSSDGKNVLVLPSDEDLLRENAFIVADPDVVCELETMV